MSPFNSEAFLAFDTGGIELSHLDFVSGGFTEAGRQNGVDFLNDQTKTASRPHLNHIRVNNISTQGFGLNGLRVWAHNTLGYKDVQISDSESFGNGYSGIYVGATQWHHQQNANVIIDRVVSHDNPGFQSQEMPYTGHGVIIAETNGGAIQNSVAYGNGKAYGNANVALWTYQSNAIVIQGNLAYGNRSAGPYDGGGFDIDGGTTNSIIQYNRSYDNDGAGYLLAQFDGAKPMSNNVFRYNLSVNDGRGDFGGITILGAAFDDLAKAAVFHNNTVVVDKNVVPRAKGALWFINGHHDDVAFLNNAFVALNGAPLIAGDTSASRATFAGNAYWTAGGQIILEDNTYNSVLSWANAAGQEKVAGQFVAVTSDPKFSDMATFQVQSVSPLKNVALMPGSGPWPSWIGSLGTRDLGGVALHQAGRPISGPANFSSPISTATAKSTAVISPFGGAPSARPELRDIGPTSTATATPTAAIFSSGNAWPTPPQPLTFQSLPRSPCWLPRLSSPFAVAARARQGSLVRRRHPAAEFPNSQQQIDNNRRVNRHGNAESQ